LLLQHVAGALGGLGLELAQLPQRMVALEVRLAVEQGLEQVGLLLLLLVLLLLCGHALLLGKLRNRVFLRSLFLQSKLLKPAQRYG
jgi:hypothetical protein